MVSRYRLALAYALTNIKKTFWCLCCWLNFTPCSSDFINFEQANNGWEDSSKLELIKVSKSNFPMTKLISTLHEVSIKNANICCNQFTLELRIKWSFLWKRKKLLQSIWTRDEIIKDRIPKRAVTKYSRKHLFQHFYDSHVFRCLNGF